MRKISMNVISSAFVIFAIVDINTYTFDIFKLQ